MCVKKEVRWVWAGLYGLGNNSVVCCRGHGNKQLGSVNKWGFLGQLSY